MAPHEDDEVHLPDIHSDEYRSRLHERGRPHGDHIRPEDDDMERRPHLDRDSALAIAMADLRMMQNGHRSEEAQGGIRFDWSFNIGHVAAILTIVCAAFASFYGIKSELQHDTDERAALEDRVHVIETGRLLNLPKLDEQGQHNKVQDEQINALREAIVTLRQTIADQARNIADLTKVIYETSQRASVLEERLGHVGPHDR